jgi:hypothetical protein
VIFEFPQIDSYGRYDNPGYGAHTMLVSFLGLRVWFSYSTPIAFSTPGHGRVVRQNDWGPTTGKHLNMIDGGDKKNRLDSEEFEKQLDAVMSSVWEATAARVIRDHRAQRDGLAFAESGIRRLRVRVGK